MLMILRPTGSEDEKFVVMTQQPRIAVGSLSFLEIPAGMLDDSGTFSGAAAKEIEEKTGVKIDASELIDMNEVARQELRSDPPEWNQQMAVYPSPGGSDEFISIFLWEKEITRDKIDAFRWK
jgi:8-oxo-dGTP pyrophosphatase MutT (NUDIX family)